MAGWWRDVIAESVVRGDHTPVVKLRPALRHAAVHRLGSDVLRRLVLGLFQFRASSTTMSASASWPPAGIVTLDPWHFPLLNTLILLTSGTTVTWAHHAHPDTATARARSRACSSPCCSARRFTCVQAYEYTHAPFTFGFNHLALAPFTDAAHANLAVGVGNFDAIYGSTFFMATGFHGFHVIVGTIFLTVCLGRAIAGQFTPDAPFRLRGRRLVLALRRRGVAVPVRLHLCAGAGTASQQLRRARAPPGAALLGLCPRCGKGKLFDGYLDVAKSCTSCGLDYAMFDAGDGPAVFVILIVGAIVCARRALRRIHLPAALLGACGAVDSADRDPDASACCAWPNRCCWCCNTSTRPARGGWRISSLWSKDNHAPLPPTSHLHCPLRDDVRDPHWARRLADPAPALEARSDRGGQSQLGRAAALARPRFGDGAARCDITASGSTAGFVNDKESYVYASGPGGAPVYHVLTPFETREDGRILMVDRGIVPPALLDPANARKWTSA